MCYELRQTSQLHGSGQLEYLPLPLHAVLVGKSKEIGGITLLLFELELPLGAFPCQQSHSLGQLETPVL